MGINDKAERFAPVHSLTLMRVQSFPPSEGVSYTLPGDAQTTLGWLGVQPAVRSTTQVPGLSALL